MYSRDLPPELPPNVIVLAGGWEHQDGTPDLSVETRMRVTALGVLARRGLAEQAFFSGGLTSPDNNLTEATAMVDYFRSRFPDLANFPIHTESESYDTTTNAQNIGKLAAQLQVRPPYTLITSASHLKRSVGIFKHAGLEVIPVKAEQAFTQRSDHHAKFANRYLQSLRHAKRIATETTLRALAVIDRKGILVRYLARRTRPNR